MTGPAQRPRGRFGLFAVDTASGEVWRDGVRLRLHDKPFLVLQALLERRGEVVTRGDLQKRLWPDGTFVEFENGLNNAVSRLREALGDSAENPTFIQTIPRRGYRFIAPVEELETDSPSGAPMVPPSSRSPGLRRFWLLGLAAAIGVTAALFLLAPRPTPPPESIAVLPFVTAGVGGGPEDEYVAFGMTEALIMELSREKALNVISATSVLRFKNDRKPLPEIARELGAGTIVEGAVVREGTHVRTSVQLIDARTDTHRWARTFRHDAKDALARQSDVARSIAREISIHINGDTAPPARAPRSVDPRAEEAYLRGRYFLRRGTEDARLRARAYFEQAIAADPGHARAHSGLADFYIGTDAMSPAEAFPEARAHALRALQLEEDLADAYASLAFVHHYFEWNSTEAERAFRRAIDFDPSHARARRWYGLFLGHSGRHEQAREQIERAVLLDPLSNATRDAAAMAWFHAREYGRMIEESNKILELDPSDSRAYEHLTAAYLHTALPEEAYAAARRGLTLVPDEPVFPLLVSIVHARTGRRNEALEMLRFVERMREDRYVPDVFLAIACAQIGMKDDAFEWLQDGYRKQDPYLMLLGASPWFDPIRDDPRFEELLGRVGLGM